jgi:hypothetical protein
VAALKTLVMIAAVLLAAWTIAQSVCPLGSKTGRAAAWTWVRMVWRGDTAFDRVQKVVRGSRPWSGR